MDLACKLFSCHLHSVSSLFHDLPLENFQVHHWNLWPFWIQQSIILLFFLFWLLILSCQDLQQFTTKQAVCVSKVSQFFNMLMLSSVGNNVQAPLSTSWNSGMSLQRAMWPILEPDPVGHVMASIPYPCLRLLLLGMWLRSAEAVSSLSARILQYLHTFTHTWFYYLGKCGGVGKR